MNHQEMRKHINRRSVRWSITGWGRREQSGNQCGKILGQTCDTILLDIMLFFFPWDCGTYRLLKFNLCRPLCRYFLSCNIHTVFSSHVLCQMFNVACETLLYVRCNLSKIMLFSNWKSFSCITTKYRWNKVIFVKRSTSS